MKKNHLYFGNDIDIPNLNSVYFSMGCFWRSESLFMKLEGVCYTEVGYAECVVDNPSCGDAFSNVEHKEVVKVYYNDKITLNQLLDTFFKNHTSDLREDFPVPSLYQSRVYVDNENDMNIYQEYVERFMTERKEKGNLYPLATKVKFIDNYRKANEHHQQYNLKK